MMAKSAGEVDSGEYNKGSRNASRTGKLRNCLVSEYVRYHIRFNTGILAFVLRFYVVPIVEYCLHYGILSTSYQIASTCVRVIYLNVPACVRLLVPASGFMLCNLFSVFKFS